jgi:cobalt-zinc-cadmium efflux system outer membrane protein
MRLQRPPEEVQTPAGMTLEELQNLAVSNNPTLIQAQAAIESARANWVQVGLYPNPNVAYMATQIGDRGTAGQQGGYIEQQFVRGRKLPLNREVAERDIAIAQRDFLSQRMRIENDVRIHFYNALVAQQVVGISEELLGIGDKALGAANELFKAKEGSRIDVLQARIEVNGARIGLTNAQNRRVAAWRRLVAVAGVPALEETPLVGDLYVNIPELTWEHSLGRILSESPELASTRIGVERALWALRRARAEPVPNVTVQAGPQYDLGANQSITNVNVAIPVPLFNYNQGNVRAAEAEFRSARAAVSRQELALTNRLAIAYERYANSRNQVERYRQDILPDAREALELVTAGYRHGELGFLSVLTAQRTYFNTNLAYLEAIRELWESSIAMEGLLLTDSLQAGDVPAGNTSGGIGKTTPGPFMGK